VSKRSSAPSQERLEQLHHQYSGNIVHIARELGRPYATVQHWFRNAGFAGRGKGGAVSSAPPEEELREIYEQRGGNINVIAEHFRANPSTVNLWYRKIGLRGKGHVPIGRHYEREVEIDLPNGRIIAFSDAHFWFKEKSPAHVALLARIKKSKPDIVVANGDVLDGSRISRHEPSGLDVTPSLSDELAVSQTHMAEIKRVSGGAACYLNLGNHDARLARYLAVNAPEAADMDGARLEHHFLGWSIQWSLRICDQLLIMHRFKGGQHASYTNVLRSGMNIATGHLHSQRVYPITDAQGTRWGVDLGFLAEKHGPQFAYTEASVLDWRSGFAEFEFKDGRMLPPQLATVLDDGTVWIQRNERLA
jgi:hypothetical protein